MQSTRAHTARSMRRTVGIALAAVVGLLPPLHSEAQALPAVEVSRETIQAATGAQPRTQVEPHIAVDPNNPQIVVAVVQQGRFPDGGATAVGYATSHDGGQTWVAGDLPQLTVATGGPFERGTDPAVAFGPDGAVYAESLVFGGPRSAIAVQRSDDGGLTFGPPVLAHDDSDASLFNDKDWIAVDTFAASPHRGRVYVAWDQGNSVGQPILLRFSDDRGKTWSPLVTVSSATSGGLGAIPLVQPNGALTVVYEDFTTGDEEVAQTSHDGGVSFAPPVTIGSFQGGALPDIRSGGLPAAAVDALTGNLYAVWEDRRFRNDGVRDIVISRSSDGGASWGALSRVNPDAANSRLDHFTPAVAALTGKVHVTYRTRDTSAGLSPLVDMRYIGSEDGGATFGSERVLGDPTDLRFASQTTTNDCSSPPCYFLGDYMGVAVSTQAVHPVWCRAFQDPAAPTARNESTWSSRVVGSCGNGIRDAGEQCDGTDAATCPGACQADCTCPCTNEVVGSQGRDHRQDEARSWLTERTSGHSAGHLRRRRGGRPARRQRQHANRPTSGRCVAGEGQDRQGVGVQGEAQRPATRDAHQPQPAPTGHVPRRREGIQVVHRERRQPERSRHAPDPDGRRPVLHARGDEEDGLKSCPSNPLFQERVLVYVVLMDTFSARAEKSATAFFSEKGG